MTLRPPTIKPSIRLTKDGDALFNKIAEEALHGHRKMLDALTEHERQLVLDWFSTALVEGKVETPIHDLLWEIDFNRKPVDIETFLMDDYYFGRSCKDLHPKWVDDLKAVFRPNSPVVEWILTGGIGIGKTTIACAGLGYKAYWLSCMRNPARYYGLLADSMVVFGIYSITKKQVNDSGYFKLRGFMDTSPYFRRDFPRSTKIDSKILFTKQNLQVITGSTNLHAIGLDLFSFLMDEVNFMRAKHDAETGKMAGQAYELYNSTQKRLVSRFMRPGGTVPGIMLLLSSRNSQTSFLEERLKVSGNSKNLYVSDYALWDVKPAHKFAGPRFKVEVGDRVARSRVLKTPRLDIIKKLNDEELSIQEAEKLCAAIKPDQEDVPRRGAQLIEVPGALLKPFLEDTDQALRDLAGVATFNLSPLIKDRQSVFDAIKPNLAHPFTTEAPTIDIQDPTMLEEFFKLKTLCRIDQGKWVPRINPTHPRYVHVDIALSGDAAGIAMSHLAGMKRTRRLNVVEGVESVVEAPYVVVDFMLRIIPPPGSEIDLAKIRAFIIWLSKVFTLGGISFDGFQSADSQQILTKMGYTVVQLSVDIKEEPYLTLRNALFERRIATYQYEPFIDEMLDLQRDISTRKIDHPQKNSRGGKGSKDVADAVCGSTYQALTHKDSLYIAKAIEITDKVFEEGDPAAPPSAHDGPRHVEVPNLTGRQNAVRENWDALAANLDD